MNQDLATNEEIVFTCGFFGDAFDVYRTSSAGAEPMYFVRWRQSIGDGLTDEFWDDLHEHLDDDDEEFKRWEETVTDTDLSEPPPDPGPSPSFDEALEKAEIGNDLLIGQPVFISADIRSELRRKVEKLIMGVSDDDRTRFGDSLPQNADEWFAREWPNQEQEN